MSTPTEGPAELVPIGEAAQLLGVSVDTLRRWERQGKVSSVRTEGGHRRYPVSAILARRDDRRTA